MAHLPYCSYPGFGETKREEQWYNQAVHVGDYIEIASQGMSNFASAYNSHN